MSGPVRPPLEVKESDDSVEVRPTNVISFDSSDFNITKSGTTATITTGGTAGTIGGSITEGQIAFGAATADSIEGSANFTYNASQVNVGIGRAPSASVGRLDIEGTGGAYGVVRITNSGTGRTLQLTCTDDEGNAAPDLYLLRSSASPTAGDYLGDILFAGQDDAGNTHNYADIRGQIDTPDDGDEAGRLEIRVRSADATGTSLNSWIRLLGEKNGTQDIMRFNDDAIDIDFQYEDEDAGVLVYFDASQKNVGIGGAPDSGVERLHVQGTGLGTLVRLESTDSDEQAAPLLELYRNSDTPAPNDYIGEILFMGNDDDDPPDAIEYTKIRVKIDDETSATEDGDFAIRVIRTGSLRTMFRIRSSEIIFNEDSQDCNFRVESDDVASMFKIDANENECGIGGAPVAGEGTLQVINDGVNTDGTATFNTYIVTKTEVTPLLTGAEVKNTLVTMDYSGGAATPTISSGSAGECVTILNINATQTVTVTAGVGLTFASTPAVLNQWESEKWVCYKANNWVRVANES